MTAVSSLDQVERNRLTVSIISQVAILDVIEDFVTGRRRGRTSMAEVLPRLGIPFPRDDSREILSRYLTVFSDEIGTVRRVRNSLTHALEVPDESIIDAAAIGDRLVAILKDTLVKAEASMRPVRDRTGRVCAWLTGDRILDLHGRTLAFIMNGQVVSRRGRHLGVLASGFIRDKRGESVAWLEGAQGGPLLPLAGLAPIPPIPDIPPVPPVVPLPPVAPVAALSWSNTTWDKFVAD